MKIFKFQINSSIAESDWLIEVSFKKVDYIHQQIRGMKLFRWIKIPFFNLRETTEVNTVAKMYFAKFSVSNVFFLNN